MVLTLYKVDWSPSVRAVYMTIEALNIPDVEIVDFNLLNREHINETFLQMNPQHTVPTLKDDDFIIWDSHAIATYLVSKYAEDDALYPTDPKKRAIIDQRLHYDSGILFPATRESALPILRRGEKSFSAEHLDRIKSAYDVFEKFLTSPWLAGDDFTLADICCVATVSTMNEILPIDKDIYTNTAAWLEHCSKKKFYKKGNLPGLELFRAVIQSKMGCKP